jgi:5'-3' exonuclease
LVQKHFLEFITWNYAYYYKGYLSWKWQYPYNHPPFISDIVETLELAPVIFDMGQPIKPIEFRFMLCLESQIDTIPKVFKHLLDDKAKAIELGVF